MKKKCLHCGKEFETKFSGQKYCLDCKNATDKCPICGQIKSIWNTYCSLKCSGIASRINKTYKCKCLGCGKEFQGRSPIAKMCDDCLAETTQCVVCGKVIPKYLEGHANWERTTCSPSCASALSHITPRTEEQKQKVLEAIRRTNQEKYGVDYYVQTKEFQEKAKESILQTYGVENVMQVPEIQEKQRKSNYANSGYECNFDNPEILARIKQTNLEKYGVEAAISSDVIRAKIMQTNNERYGVDWPSQSTEIQKKIQAINDGHLGKPEVRQQIYKTNIETYGCIYPNQRNYPEYLKKLFNEIYVPTGYDVVGYFQLHKLKTYKDLKNHDPQHADILLHIAQRFNIEIEMPKLPAGCSWVEFEIQDWLKDYSIISEHRHRAKEYGEIDIFIPEDHIGIEYNGTYWHASENGSSNLTSKSYHQDKSLHAENLGIFIYHIFEYDWLNPVKREIIKSQLLNLLHKTPNKIYARNCELKRVNYQDAAKFINENHLQGDGNLNKQINYGLYYNDELVYIMTFGKWRRGYKGKIQWEIFRSCSKLYTTVVGGAEKCFKQFLKDYPEGTIGTYSAIQSGTGKLYERLGFKFEKITEPSAVRVALYHGHQIVYTMFTKEFRTRKDLPLIYNCGNKLWIYNR